MDHPATVDCDNRLLVLLGNRAYSAAVKRETQAWGSHFVLQQRRSIEYSYPPIAAYRNQVITGDSGTTWPEYLKARFGRFERALSIGVGTGWIEESLIKQGLVSSIELGDLSQAAVEHAAHRLHAVDTTVKVSVNVYDVNFIHLEPERYDLILCHSILHHTINLEHLLVQLNLALKARGVLVVDEFIGPSRWQWPGQTCAIVNAIMNGLTGGQRLRPLAPSELAVMIMSSPFESIRSSELAALLGHQFQDAVVLERRFMGFLYPAILTLDFSNWDHPGLREIVEKCIELDIVFTRTGLLPPCFIFGVYHKSLLQIQSVMPFSRGQIQKLLNPIWSASPLRIAKWVLGPIVKPILFQFANVKAPRC